MTMRSDDAMTEVYPVRRMEVFSGAGRRRTWSTAAKAQIVAESYSCLETVCAVARRHPHRGRRRPGGCGQVRRSPAALPPSPDLWPPRYQARSLDPGRLGGASGLPAPTCPRAAAGDVEAIGQAVRQRDDGAGAGSGARSHQDRPAMCLGTVGNFVFGPGIVGKKEISHGPTQRAVDT